MSTALGFSPPDIEPAIDWAQPVASTATLASAQTDFTIVDVDMVPVLLGWLDQFTRISPRIEGCRSQKYGYTPGLVNSTVVAAPLPSSR